jgi:hypothetical protein
MSGYTYD